MYKIKLSITTQPGKHKNADDEQVAAICTQSGMRLLFQEELSLI